MNLSNILKDPIDIPLLLLYVTGVLIMVYSAMQFVHYFIYKSKAHLHSGIKTLVLALVLLAPRLTYQHIRIDGSDYKKAVKAAVSSAAKVYESSGSETDSQEKAQMEALSERLSALGYTVSLDTSVEEKDDVPFTLRNLSAVKEAVSDSKEPGFILISTVLGTHEGENGPSHDAANVSVLEALCSKLKNLDTDTEIRFLISSDGREGQDAVYNYLSHLNEDDKNRCLMNISFELLGLSDYTGFDISTVNGVNNPLSLSMKASVKKMTGQKVSLQQEKNSQIVSFHINGIPSVSLKQAYVDKADTAKTPDKLNEDEIGDMAAIIGNILMPVMEMGDSELLNDFETEVAASANTSEDNPYFPGSFRPGKDVFSKDTASKETMLQCISENFGARLTDTGLTDKAGNSLYSGSLYLLNLDSPVNVLFHIGESGLIRITADTGNITSSKDELTQILYNLFGEPEISGNTSSWKDEDAGAEYVISEQGADDETAPESLELTKGGYSFYILKG